MILHVDMDAFYASIEIRDRPDLASLPVVVGGSPEGRGVVCAANYVARKYGIHSAMPASTALRRCPHLVMLPSRMRYYAEVSDQLRVILSSYTPLVEPLALDEAFLDVSGTEHLFGSPLQIARSIKSRVATELQLVASVGVAPNKYLAKVASDLEKPDGLVVVDKHGVQEFLDPLSVTRLWGVGKRTAARLEQLGLRTIGQLRQVAPESLTRMFGKTGDQLWRLAHGRDSRRVVPDRDAKSISHETTFARDVDRLEVLEAVLVDLTEQVGWRLRRHGMRGRTVQLKVRYADFQTAVRSKTLGSPTDVTDEIWQAAHQLLCERCQPMAQPIRLLGIGMHNLERGGEVQASLFPDDPHVAHRRLDATVDEIRSRFGRRAVERGLRREPPPDHPDTA